MSNIQWFVKDNVWLHKDRPELRENMGWGNGYVLLPFSHPCYGMSYEEVGDKYSIIVSGGLTFSDSAIGLEWIPEEFKGQDLWVFGFDTCHYSDSPRNWPKELVEKHTQQLVEQFENITQ
jgi:hypothetical protein